jgi:hypothetical protein
VVLVRARCCQLWVCDCGALVAGARLGFHPMPAPPLDRRKQLRRPTRFGRRPAGPSKYSVYLLSYIFPPARRLHRYPPPRPLHMHMHMHTRTHLDLIYRTFSLPPNTTYKSEPAGRWWRCTEASAAARHSPTACCCSAWS